MSLCLLTAIVVGYFLIGIIAVGAATFLFLTEDTSLQAKLDRL